MKVCVHLATPFTDLDKLSTIISPDLMKLRNMELPLSDKGKIKEEWRTIVVTELKNDYEYLVRHHGITDYNNQYELGRIVIKHSELEKL